ncbi:hypothetical protein [Mailhella massiliensis]|uniref:hypothetical protein n=1 Tax=Mailhella massiliensis TaxID=1903261 RepID=UPI00097D4B7C|nr:hypothetical protein [Mailhella massiliensis]
MSFEEFIQTKGFGFLALMIIYLGCLKLTYEVGYERGHRKGAGQVIHDRQEAVNFVYGDGKILRFIPGYDRPVLLDLNDNTITYLRMKPKEEDKEDPKVEGELQ